VASSRKINVIVAGGERKMARQRKQKFGESNRQLAKNIEKNEASAWRNRRQA
jgi:hypothetical protein